MLKFQQTSDVVKNWAATASLPGLRALAETPDTSVPIALTSILSGVRLAADGGLALGRNLGLPNGLTAQDCFTHGWKAFHEVSKELRRFEGKIGIRRALANEVLQHFENSAAPSSQPLDRLLDHPESYRRLWIEAGMLNWIVDDKAVTNLLNTELRERKFPAAQANLISAAKLPIAVPTGQTFATARKAAELFEADVAINPLSYRKLLAMALLEHASRAGAIDEAALDPLRRAAKDQGAENARWLGLYREHCPAVPADIYKYAEAFLKRVTPVIRR